MDKILSIVISTLNRKNEISFLLESIYKNISCNIYEVIIVDQNFSDLLDDIVAEYSNLMTIRHFKVSFRGLSKAKNFGIKKSFGEYIIFMDDDAEIIPGSIELGIKSLNSDIHLDAISGRMVDRNGADSVKKFSDNFGVLNLKDFEDKFIESSMMFRKSCLSEEYFDENLGCGVFHGAEEGYDLVYRLLKGSHKIIYNPAIKFYHPNTISSHSSESEIKRVFNYRCGFAALCRKHGFNKKYYSRLIKVFMYIPYLTIFKRKYLRYYIAELMGLITGRIVK